MTDDDCCFVTRPTPARPLLGVTVLVVEDSRFACEAMRLLCLRSGARIRRAGSLHNARRHLQTYRPTVVIVDLGLPDGPGEALIAELARATPRVEVILATSGDPESADRAIAAGADGFLEKPVASLGAFQALILQNLPACRRPAGIRLVSNDEVRPDDLAYRDDLVQVADALAGDPRGSVDYVAQFLHGVSRSARDEALSRAASQLVATRARGADAASEIAVIATMVQERLGQRAAI